jgi:hypothetical protein
MNVSVNQTSTTTTKQNTAQAKMPTEKDLPTREGSKPKTKSFLRQHDITKESTST